MPEHVPQLSITENLVLCFLLCSACYTALQMKNSVRSTFPINPATIESAEGSQSMLLLTANQHLGAVNEKKSDTMEDKGNPMMRGLYILQYARVHLLG